jgi:hypothetical protein
LCIVVGGFSISVFEDRSIAGNDAASPTISPDFKMATLLESPDAFPDSRFCAPDEGGYRQLAKIGGLTRRLVDAA